VDKPLPVVDHEVEIGCKHGVTITVLAVGNEETKAVERRCSDPPITENLRGEHSMI